VERIEPGAFHLAFLAQRPFEIECHRLKWGLGGPHRNPVPPEIGNSADW
jgi:hypothetical protein